MPKKTCYLLYNIRTNMQDDWCHNQTHLLVIVLHRAANKRNDSHLVVFALSVLQSQLQTEALEFIFFGCCSKHVQSPVFKLTCATLMPVQKLMFPRGCTACSLERILPVSGVSVVSTSQLLRSSYTCIKRLHFKASLHCLVHTGSYFDMVIRPTLFSGLLRVLVWQTMLTASCWACSRVGRKSPFRMYSLLSTLEKDGHMMISLSNDY